MSFTRRARAAWLLWPATAALCLVLAACGQTATKTTGDPSATDTGTASTHDPGGGTASTSRGDPGDSATRSEAVGNGSGGTRKEVADPDEADSYPAPTNVRHASAASPARASEAARAAGSLSDAEIRQDLHETEAAETRAHKQQQSPVLTPVAGGQSIGGDGKIPIPTNVPEVIQKVIAGANEIADFPYVFGGGHGSFIDHAYDCSGSVSYALAAGGLLSSPEVSGELEHWGAPGPGRYITVYANAGHAYMYVDGILYDTAGRSGVYASRWLVGSTDNSGFVARHPPGY